jgi:hypothetical protein
MYEACFINGYLIGKKRIGKALQLAFEFSESDNLVTTIVQMKFQICLNSILVFLRSYLLNKWDSNSVGVTASKKLVIDRR